eukprot:2530285-Rhodomonas_salina.1
MGTTTQRYIIASVYDARSERAATRSAGAGGAESRRGERGGEEREERRGEEGGEEREEKREEGVRGKHVLTACV